ncbi:MAG TPA: DUF1963 domain-containing protein [Galbitalea sp.]|jgi:hypothetical protein
MTRSRAKRIETVIYFAIIAVIVVVVILQRLPAGSVHVAPASTPFTDGCTTTDPASPMPATDAQAITYVAQKKDVAGLVTKFGGQPTWLEKPQWPISRSQNVPMTFIGQIVIDPKQFPGSKAKMAYLFISDGVHWADGMWDPDHGENAVILQPGGQVEVTVSHQATGPSETTDGKRQVAYLARQTTEHEPAYLSENQLQGKTHKQFDAYEKRIEEDKIGGVPSWIQGAEFPCTADRLLLQFGSVPFDVNLGDAGEGYAFINSTGTVGKLLTQSY